MAEALETIQSQDMRSDERLREKMEPLVDSRLPSIISIAILQNLVQESIDALGENASQFDRGEAVTRALCDAYDLLSEENKQRMREHAELQEQFVAKMRGSS